MIDSISAQEIVPGVFILVVDGQTRLATRSNDPVPVYGERILCGYRLWDPFRSKLAALLLKSKGRGLRLKRDSKVLYLGAATGTTVSHVSDIVADGLVYAVEFSPRSMRDLIRLCERRENIIPILADAAQPETVCRSCRARGSGLSGYSPAKSSRNCIHELCAVPAARRRTPPHAEDEICGRHSNAGCRSPD